MPTLIMNKRYLMSQVIGIGDENSMELMTRVRVRYTYLV